MKKGIIVGAIILLLSASLSLAEETQESADQMRKELAETRDDLRKMQILYEAKIKNMQARIEKLEEAKGVAAGPAVSQGIPQPSYSETKPADLGAKIAGAVQSFNPDISVIGDMNYHYATNKTDQFYHQFQFRELELAFSAAVDPYARADVFTSLGQNNDNSWNFELEEGYLTLLHLPFDLQAKVGQFRADFGKANKYHLHNMPWFDYPAIVRDYFGEDGMKEPGIALFGLVPNPWDVYSELTVETFDNRNADAFAGADGRDLVILTHWKNFFDVSPASTLELGGSFAAAPNDDGHGGHKTIMEGADATYKWRPLKKGLYQSLTFQNELFASQKDMSAVFDGDGKLMTPDGRVDSVGFYTSLVYQFAMRWSVFSRYDYSELPFSNTSRDNAISGGLTFAQSEYAFWRLQYTHLNRNYDKDDDQIWLQLNFGIGPHRKHEY